MTFVPVVRPVKSSVWPAGTARSPMVMVLQLCLAVGMSLTLVIVQDVLRSSRVEYGSTGAAWIAANWRAAAMREVVILIVERAMYLYEIKYDVGEPFSAYVA